MLSKKFSVYCLPYVGRFPQNYPIYCLVGFKPFLTVIMNHYLSNVRHKLNIYNFTLIYLSKPYLTDYTLTHY
jgi:hypothetical protein